MLPQQIFKKLVIDWYQNGVCHWQRLHCEAAISLDWDWNQITQIQKVVHHIR